MLKPFIGLAGFLLPRGISGDISAVRFLLPDEVLSPKDIDFLLCRSTRLACLRVVTFFFQSPVFKAFEEIGDVSFIIPKLPWRSDLFGLDRSHWVKDAQDVRRQFDGSHGNAAKQLLRVVIEIIEGARQD